MLPTVHSQCIVSCLSRGGMLGRWGPDYVFLTTELITSSGAVCIDAIPVSGMQCQCSFCQQPCFFFFLDRLVRVLWCHACKYSYNPKGLLAQSVKGAVTHLFVIFMHTTEGMSPRASLQTAFQRLDASK